jgi:hypothetical protein
MPRFAMPITRRREHLAGFRLTDLELEALKRVCEAKGSRNLSEFARTELLSCARSIEVAIINRPLFYRRWNTICPVWKPGTTNSFAGFRWDRRKSFAQGRR